MSSHTGAGVKLPAAPERRELPRKWPGGRGCDGVWQFRRDGLCSQRDTGPAVEVPGKSWRIFLDRGRKCLLPGLSAHSPSQVGSRQWLPSLHNFPNCPGRADGRAAVQRRSTRLAASFFRGFPLFQQSRAGPLSAADLFSPHSYSVFAGISRKVTTCFPCRHPSATRLCTEQCRCCRSSLCF